MTILFPFYFLWAKSISGVGFPIPLSYRKNSDIVIGVSRGERWEIESGQGRLALER